jgi:hypothetical protein
MTSDLNHDTVVIKAVLNHPRVKNEADFLKLYQNRSPHLRPLVDEIVEPYNYPTIALRHLDDHLLNASIDRALNRQEVKHVSRCVLEHYKYYTKMALYIQVCLSAIAAISYC